ncbi:carbonic anhydrase-related protein 10-like isoform X1 [Varroa jacobsoni]|uniref:Alpha-carbonic anhydrase domain-containing protein n=1 Tax=Varroa destructor TaxID=109461 RepID=A0A7M7KBM3_VARDE|nr:carbonic anhydrase-related protein 10-like isoform X1 [Varroa destructor]XP_022699195.1 carbonic anhydrase-related protein 10-like isoform X1 [Varroa jacobsoni]
MWIKLVAAVIFLNAHTAWANWEQWWTYDGISGPDFWGLLNPDWHLCSRGRAQSPIDLDPQQLLFDPRLKPFVMDPVKVSGILLNTGHDIVLKLNDTPKVNISGGPLSYQYTLSEVHIHYGNHDEHGSEHTIAGKHFPAEIQFLGYNSELHSNLSEAIELRESSGLIAIAVLVQLANQSHPDFRFITSQLHKITYRDQETTLEDFEIEKLMPSTEEYMTYAGSLSQPGCVESVRWLVMNKALQVSKQQLYLLRKLMQGDQDNPKAPLWNNRRPRQPLNNRVVYTNIDFKRAKEGRCPTMHKNMYYTANPRNFQDDLSMY